MVRWGKTERQHRWRCEDCGRTFKLLTGTPLSRLRYSSRWEDFAVALLEGETLRKAAERCGIHRTTAHRWPTRFLKELVKLQPRLTGIVEADETYVLESAKGRPKERAAHGRPARRRGGKARSRGLSRDQIPVVMARDGGGAIVCEVLPHFDQVQAIKVFRSTLTRDAVLCTDQSKVYPGTAKSIAVKHETVSAKSGGRIRGPYHIQNVNALPSRFKLWLLRFRGVSDTRLPPYAAWFVRIVEEEDGNGAPAELVQSLLAA